MTIPLFSIILPFFNREFLVRETIESVLRQSFINFELFVVNDGSTDNTQDTLLCYKNFIKLINQPNQGPEIARNTGVEHAKGDFWTVTTSFFQTPCQFTVRLLKESKSLLLY